MFISGSEILVELVQLRLAVSSNFSGLSGADISVVYYYCKFVDLYYLI